MCEDILCPSGCSPAQRGPPAALPREACALLSRGHTLGLDAGSQLSLALPWVGPHFSQDGQGSVVGIRALRKGGGKSIYPGRDFLFLSPLPFLTLVFLSNAGLRPLGEVDQGVCAWGQGGRMPQQEAPPTGEVSSRTLTCWVPTARGQSLGQGCPGGGSLGTHGGLIR